MQVFVISLIVMLFIIAAMAIGVIMGRKPIKGSCGGVGAALGENNYVCDICGGDPARCDENRDGLDVGIAYEASGAKSVKRTDH